MIIIEISFYCCVNKQVFAQIHTSLSYIYCFLNSKLNKKQPVAINITQAYVYLCQNLLINNHQFALQFTMIVLHITVAIYTLLTASRMLYVWPQSDITHCCCLPVNLSYQMFILYVGAPFLTASRMFLFAIPYNLIHHHWLFFV